MRNNRMLPSPNPTAFPIVDPVALVPFTNAYPPYLSPPKIEFPIFVEFVELSLLTFLINSALLIII